MGLGVMTPVDGYRLAVMHDLNGFDHGGDLVALGEGRR